MQMTNSFRLIQTSLYACWVQSRYQIILKTLAICLTGTIALPPNHQSLFAQEKASDTSTTSDKADKPGAPEPDGWVNLFDGKTIEGWTRRGGAANFVVEDATIVGNTVVGEPNSFLCTNKNYKNFELQLEFRVDNSKINSGVQIRSNSLPDYKSGRVHGYQVEIDASARAWTGGIYDESRRGWLFNLEKLPDARQAFRLAQWNSMKVVCNGPSIRTWINDIPVADLTDDMTQEGFIALQVHATDSPQSMQVRWRNVRIKELP